MATRAGIWIPGRRSGVRAAVWPRRGIGDLGKAGDQPPGFARTRARTETGHGLCAGDVLAVHGRLERGANRRRDWGTGNGPRRDPAVSGRRVAGGGSALSHREWTVANHAGERSCSEPARDRNGGIERKDGRSGSALEALSHGFRHMAVSVLIPALE